MILYESSKEGPDVIETEKETEGKLCLFWAFSCHRTLHCGLLALYYSLTVSQLIMYRQGLSHLDVYIFIVRGSGSYSLKSK